MESIAEGVWGLPGRERMPGGVIFPLRMTIVRLPDGALWLHSPVPVTDASAAAIDALGPVRHIVSPSLIHHLHLGPARERWPEATLYGSPALAAKRPDLGSVTPMDPCPWAESFELVRISGAPSLDEHVFFHKPSGSLLVTDLLFHITEPETLATRMVLTMMGANGQLRPSRAWRWIVSKDRAAVGASVRKILEWPIQRLIPCHGEVASADATRAALEGMARW